MQRNPPGADQASPPDRSRLKRVFVDEQGLRPLWSVLLFVAIFQLLEAGAIAALGRFVSLKRTGPIPPALAFQREFCEVLAVLGGTWIMAGLESRPLFSFGYAGGDKLLRLVSGALWGFLSLSVLVGVLRKSGSLVFDGWSLRGLVAWKYAFARALVFLLVGIFEESLLRGYLQSPCRGESVSGGRHCCSRSHSRCGMSAIAANHSWGCSPSVPAASFSA